MDKNNYLNLEVDKSHKKLDLSNLNEPIKKAKIFILGAVMATSIYTGDFVETTYADEGNSYEVSETYDDYSSIIPNCFHEDISNCCNKSIDSITDYDISLINNLTLNITERESLEFLDNFVNLNSLCLNFCNTNDEYCLDTLPYIPSLNDLSISASEDLEISSFINNKFIENNCDNIEYLTLNGVSVGPNSIEKFTSLKNVKITVTEDFDINYHNFKTDNFDLSWYGPYDVPINMNRNGYQSLMNNGTKIDFGGYENEGKYKEVLDKIDDIISSLDVDSSSTDKEKLDAVLCYVIENYEYDKEIQSAIDNGEDLSKYNFADTFYKGGNLYAIFNKNAIICGNYTALVKTLLKELGINSYYMFNASHAWNLVSIENELYYVDATIMDLENDRIVLDKIESGNGENVDWYMESAAQSHIDQLDPSGDHDPVLFPKYLGTRRYAIHKSSKPTEAEKIETKSAEEIDNKLFDLDIDGKNYKIPGAIAIGLLAALGASRKIKRSRKRKKSRIISGYENYPYYYDYDPKKGTRR